MRGLQFIGRRSARMAGVVVAVGYVSLAYAALSWVALPGFARAKDEPLEALAAASASSDHVVQMPRFSVGLSIVLGSGVEAFHHVFVGEGVAEHSRKQGFRLAEPVEAIAQDASLLECSGVACAALSHSMLDANQGVLLSIQLKRMQAGLFSEMRLFAPGTGWRKLEQVSGKESSVLSEIVRQTESLDWGGILGCTVLLTGEYEHDYDGPAAGAILIGSTPGANGSRWYLPPGTRVIRRPNGQAFSIACQPGHHYRLRREH